ncbi:MAG: P1 family peptidase [Longimicrobiales bacterium]|nr:P1 family peptidase [Longimicrobiales bacterium]
MNDTLTAVEGLRVGHAEVGGGGSGCTVILGPFRGVADVRGLATGTRELDALSPEHLVPRIDAILLTGGSAFGLASADGVMAHLEERGIGFDTGVARVPIVPAAVIFDLAEGVDRPGPEEGRRACEAASDGPVPEGSVGAGAGARVGKVTGRERASPGGLGCAAGRHGEHTIGVLAVVNALGDVLDGSGSIVAGARGEDGRFLDTAALLRNRGVDGEFGRVDSSSTEVRPGTNTTLVVVATDAPLGAPDLERVARLASTGLARRISPVNTPFDGDIVFSVSTAAEPLAHSPGRVMSLGTVARDLVEEAVERGVRAGAGS